MNEIKIFSSEEYNKIEEIKKERKMDYYGYVYALEWGNTVKIGQTINFKERLTALKCTARYANAKIGKIAISIPHSNYIENEKRLHKIYNRQRIENTELFKTNLSDVATTMSMLEFSFDKPEHKADRIIEGLINWITGEQNSIKIDEYKYYIKPFNMIYNIPIDSDEVYTKCIECEEEIELSLQEIIDKDTGCIDFDRTYTCENCMKAFRKYGKEE